MQIVDVNESNIDLFCLCLEDWSTEAKSSGPKRCQWVRHHLSNKGFRAKIALDENGTEGGMIQYGPIEHSHVDGSALYFIYCIHVHGYKQGRGNFQHRGMGKMLLRAAEEDARAQGAKGMAAWGVWLPFWMKASWFKKHGYRKADRTGLATLLWKPFFEDARPPRWIAPKTRFPDAIPGKVNITAFSSGWCMAQNLVYERTKTAASEFEDKVYFHDITITSREDVAHWGVADGVFINGRNIQKGPPPSYKQIYKAIARQIKKI